MSRPKMRDGAHKKVVTLTINPLILILAKDRCHKDGVSLSAKVEEMLWDYIDTIPPANRSAPATSPKTS
jgi:hypothetical protein